jgi:uncharacterized protein DUF6174
VSDGRTSESFMAAQPRKRTWVWFFAVLGLLSLAAIIVPLFVVPMVHGLVPVTRENFDAARRRWERAGVRDYDLEYRKKGSATGSFQVQVRNGKAISVIMDDHQLDRTSNPKLYDYQTMSAMFDDLETFLDLASKPGATPSILRARFDPVDGHIIRYIYSVTGTPQKVEVGVRLQRVEPSNLPPH